MWERLRNGRPVLARLASRLIAAQPVRAQSTATVDASSTLAATSDVAQRLAETGIGRSASRRRNAGAMPVHEPRRVNIVSEGLCDDIVNYLATSLERHRGCDLVDLNPGVGLWSRKLHDFLEPRQHIMMDPDAELYLPFLSDLVAKKKVSLIPKSGILWRDLLDMINTHLSAQREIAKGSPPPRNDTLLVTANLAAFPKKAYHTFDCVSTMVLYQFMSSIRTSTLFQRYGQVRMLVWINDDGKTKYVPRSMTRRRRSAVDAEISCEWIHEVAGVDAEAGAQFTPRDNWINLESGYKTLERMEAQGLRMPAGRETALYVDLRAKPGLAGTKLADMHPPSLARSFKQELQVLEEELASGSSPKASARLRALRKRGKTDKSDSLLFHDLVQQHEAVAQLAESSPGEFARADAAWNERVARLTKSTYGDFNAYKDSYLAFRQDPPLLLWDRRAFEPLCVRADEFFPNAPTALLDIQPKAMHPLLLQHGPGSSRSGDMSDAMLRFWLNYTLAPVQRAMNHLWGGFGDLVTECPSLRDRSRGGSPLTGHGELTVRRTNEQQWCEILQAWMNWPFRPSFSQMLGRLDEDVEGDMENDDEVKSGAGGVL